MTTKKEIQKFIDKLSVLAIAEKNKRSKWILPSVCIAQAALETGFGDSSLMTKANAFFGIKATKSWTGKVYSSKTKECYDNVNMTTETAYFRAYDSLEDSVTDYFDLITGSSRYAKAVNESDAKTAITAIKDGGYATDPNYVSKVMNIINTYNLTQYDQAEKVLKVDGEWGRDTTTKSQMVLGTTVDGIVSNQLTSCQEYVPNALESSWEVSNNRTGSELIRSIQKLIGLTGSDVDGQCGFDTVTAMQEFLTELGFYKGAIDGIMGELTVSAWQQYINSRLEQYE